VSEPRVIKKYPNRRLYDTAISSYITLEDVRRLVLDHADFRVRDARTNEDITRSILLQIIIEQEADGVPIFSVEVLEQIIRLYGHTMQGMVTTWFERSLKMFKDQQDGMREQMQNMMTGDPLSIVRGMTEQNLSMWKEMQETFVRAAMGSGRISGATARDDPEDEK
jgi:polyhydroxyalkanoate synthesis repressor PhaR